MGKTTTEKILSDWKKKQFKPLYWIEGEEGYFIDRVMDQAEHHLLSEQEASFNLTVFYGRDAAWSDVVNACRRYPMFSEKQVVLIKEAQHMKDIDMLEPYIEQPLESTIFVVGYKDKKIDRRTKFGKLVESRTECATTQKIQDFRLPEWTSQLVHEKGYVITPPALAMLVDHIGNDLSRLSNEVDKLLVNLGARREIRDVDIEQFIGVSREFNVFELQNSLARKELPKAMRIIEYFGHNPKAAPIQLVLPALYAFFSKTYMLFSYPMDNEKAAAEATGISSYHIREHILAARNYSFQGVEQALVLLHEYNLRSIGINDAGTADAELLKELVVKMTGRY